MWFIALYLALATVSIILGVVFGYALGIEQERKNMRLNTQRRVDPPPAA